MGAHGPGRRTRRGREELIGLSDQLPLIGPRGGLRPRPPRRPDDTTPSRRVSVLVESRVPHLARSFTYSVPPKWDDRVTPGIRVRVRVAGRLVEGFVEADDTGYPGAVTPIESVVSTVPVLAPEILDLCGAVAEHYAGSTADVVRLAVPPRVAAVEEGYAPGPRTPVPPPPPGVLDPFAAAAADGRAVRGTWPAPAGPGAEQAVAGAAARVAAAGRGVLIVVPDGRDVARFAAAVAAVAPGAVAVLRADDPPGERYRAFLAVRCGRTPIVVGTRAAAFAPVADLGLLVLWDDGDPSLAEQRAPYPNAREVLALRSHRQRCALLLAGHSRSPEGQRWLDNGWLQDLGDPAVLRARRPAAFSTADRVRSPFDLGRRLPASAVAALRTGLETGPVLVQVARTGYLPLTACAECRELAQCPACTGPLAVAADGTVSCRRCSWEGRFRCPHCHHERLRAVRAGARRTAEELGRMFPGTPVLQSTGDHPLTEVAADPAIVVATPGVEPPAVGGYRAGALLDAQSDLWRVGVRAREDALRRWFAAAALLRPESPLAVVADSADETVQALIRWDPGLAARAELRRRAEVGLPPARQILQVDGHAADVAAVLADLPETVDVLGPRALPEGAERVLLRAPDFPAVRDHVHQLALARAAAHQGRPLRLQVDPAALD